jgi:hypothetical protein
VGRCASAQRQPRCQPRPRLSTRRLSAASALRHEVRGEPVGAGGEVGLVVCKPGGGAAGETRDEAACIAAPAPAGAGRRQPAEPAAAGEAGCSLQDRCRPAWPAPGSMCYPPTGRIGRRRPARQGASSVVRGRRVQVAVTKPEAVDQVLQVIAMLIVEGVKRGVPKGTGIFAEFSETKAQLVEAVGVLLLFEPPRPPDTVVVRPVAEGYRARTVQPPGRGSVQRAMIHPVSCPIQPRIQMSVRPSPRVYFIAVVRPDPAAVDHLQAPGTAEGRRVPEQCGTEEHLRVRAAVSRQHGVITP